MLDSCAHARSTVRRARPLRWQAERGSRGLKDRSRQRSSVGQGVERRTHFRASKRRRDIFLEPGTTESAHYETSAGPFEDRVNRDEGLAVPRR